MYCCNCQRDVNYRTTKVPFVFAYIINYHCEECNIFIGSDIEDFETEEDKNKPAKRKE
jgi:hypothetical protein